MRIRTLVLVGASLLSLAVPALAEPAAAKRVVGQALSSTQAVVLDEESGEYRIVRLGDELNGSRVVAIGADEVVLIKGGSKELLSLAPDPRPRAKMVMEPLVINIKPMAAPVAVAAAPVATPPVVAAPVAVAAPAPVAVAAPAPVAAPVAVAAPAPVAAPVPIVVARPAVASGTSLPPVGTSAPTTPQPAVAVAVAPAPAPIVITAPPIAVPAATPPAPVAAPLVAPGMPNIVFIPPGGQAPGGPVAAPLASPPPLAPPPVVAPAPVSQPAALPGAMIVPRGEMEHGLGDFAALDSSVTLEVAPEGGFHVAELRAGSFLSRLGLHKGDTIQRVDGRVLRTVEDASAAYNWVRVTDHFSVDLVRDGHPLMLRFQVGS